MSPLTIVDGSRLADTSGGSVFAYSRWPAARGTTAVVSGAVSVGSWIPTTTNGSPRRFTVSPTFVSCWRAMSEPRTVTSDALVRRA